MSNFSRLVLFAAMAGGAAFATVRIPTGEAMERATVKPKPEYTGLAQKMKVTGKVEIEITIAPDGSVEDAKPLSGNPLLTGPTANTLKKWKFNPVKANGEPTSAVTTLVFNFSAD